MQNAPDTQLFPYMAFARTEAFGSRFCLSQSGMAPPDPALLGPPEPLDLGFACAGALQDFQERVAEHVGVPAARVLVTVGASSAMHLCALRLFRGARVVADTPSYEPFRALPGLLGGELALVQRRREDGWQLDPERVAAALDGAGTGHVFVTNPHNPTGAETDASALGHLAELAARANGVLISGEVYQEFRAPGTRTYAFRHAPNAISIGSLTKAYGLGGLRLGWMVFGEDAVALRPRLEDGVYLAYVDPPTPALRAGLRALDALPRLREPIERVEREAKPHLARFLVETPGVDGLLPESGIIAFPWLEGVGDTRAFARWLAAEHEVDVVPGEFFDAPGHLRIGFGQPAEIVAEGLARLATGVEEWRRRG